MLPWYKCTLITWFEEDNNGYRSKKDTGAAGSNRREDWKKNPEGFKSLAEYFDITLGDLLEAIVLHAFEGKCAFTDKTLKHIIEFKKIFGIDFDAGASHRMIDRDEPTGPG